jgi:hypothetical protein
MRNPPVREAITKKLGKKNGRKAHSVVRRCLRPNIGKPRILRWLKRETARSGCSGSTQGEFHPQPSRG